MKFARKYLRSFVNLDKMTFVNKRNSFEINFKKFVLCNEFDANEIIIDSFLSFEYYFNKLGKSERFFPYRIEENML